MGRPLFVAPVETDLPHKDAPKRDVLSPSRSAIRRSTQAETRERRNPNRRAAVRIVAIPPHTHSARRHPAWAPDDANMDPERTLSEESASRPSREALRDVTTRPDRPGRDRYLEEQMSSIFGGTWHNIGPLSSQRDDEVAPERDFWWNSEIRPRRARIVAPDNPRRNRSPHGRRSYHIGTPPFRSTADITDRLQSESATSNDDTAPPFAFHPYRSLRRNQARTYRALMSHSLPNSRPLPRTHPTDGLGDRDRSLSPEVWDTLLTTLTPDPQPPSASSSFASATVSQSAGPSNALPSAPGVPDETVDGACESGHENSDDDNDDGDTYFSRLPRGFRSIDHQLRRHFRRHQSVPDYNLDGPSDGPHTHRPEPPRPGQSPGGSLTNHYSVFLGNGWTGRLSHAGSEDERGADRLRPNREGSAGSGPGAHTGDEEWLGMQRIVRSLAAREDIPDEWWAEAGLNRTLPHDESN